MPEFEGNKILQAECIASSLFFTRYMFAVLHKHDFVVNWHHVEMCKALDGVLNGDVRRLMINIAPRYSKTILAVKHFIANGFALNPASNFIHLSYSDDLATDNSDAIRDIVKSDAYQNIFPYVEVSKTSDSKKKWLTLAGGGLYAVSTGGQVTGFGAGAVDVDEEDGLAELIAEVEGVDNRVRTKRFSGAIVIDDPLKPDDALSDVKRERVNTRFETTIRSRVNSRHTPIIVIMQRLHERDLCGYLLEVDGEYSEDNPSGWHVLKMPCIGEKDGKEVALWEHKHSLDELHQLRERNPFVFDTQYMQNPKPLYGLLYDKDFRIYTELPNKGVVKAYTDTADTGKDFLCSIVYLETEYYNYVLDVLYTQEPMEITERQTAAMMNKHGVVKSIVESNSGGRGFARNIERLCRDEGNFKTSFEWFYQSQNKESRILTNSAEVQNIVMFPQGWEHLFPKFHYDLTNHTRIGRNRNDDAPDALTGTVEHRTKPIKQKDLDSLRNIFI